MTEEAKKDFEELKKANELPDKAGKPVPATCEELMISEYLELKEKNKRLEAKLLIETDLHEKAARRADACEKMLLALVRDFKIEKKAYADSGKNFVWHAYSVYDTDACFAEVDGIMKFIDEEEKKD